MQPIRYGLEASPFAWSLQFNLLEYLETIWERPDQGIWEIRGEPRHFTFSKVMAWVAFDRAIKSVEQYGLVGAVTQDKAVLCQLLGDGKNRVPQALVVMRKEFEVSGQQRRGVERIRLIVLAQHASITDTMSEDVRPDLVRGCTPCRRHTWVASDLRQPARAVKGDPTHQLRGNIVLWLAPGLPDALVRVTPDASGTGCLHLDDRPEAARQTPAAAGVE